MRLLADGTPDPGFGANGAVDSTAVQLAGRARDVLVLPDGRITLAAAVERGRAARATFLAARLTAAGAFDRTFNGDGVARVATTTRRVRGGGAAALALDRRGRLLLAGTARGSASGLGAAVLRLRGGGRRDRSFGVGGLSAGRLPRTKIAALGVRGDGAVVFTGSARIGGRDNLAVARLRGR
jgi:uncharacterized delta-60 repeat protein